MYSSVSESNQVRCRTNCYFMKQNPCIKSTYNHRQKELQRSRNTSRKRENQSNLISSLQSNKMRSSYRSRSRSRSRSPDHRRRDRDKDKHRDNHRGRDNDRSHRDRDRKRDRDRNDKSSRAHRDRERQRDRDRNNRDREHQDSSSKPSNDARNKLIAQRSASVIRAQSVLRSNSVLRSIAKPTVNHNVNISHFKRKDISQTPTSSHTKKISIAKKTTIDSTEEPGRSKPKFLSRKQREQIALQKLHEQRANQRAKQMEDTKKREKFFRAVRESKHIHHKKGSIMDNDNDIRMRDNHNNRNKNNPRNKQITRSQRDEMRRIQQRNEELQLIKDQYLGKKRQKKIIVPPSQKFKFKFDWETSEDKSEDLNELYSRRAKISFLFGRGYLAGIDRDEQNKKNEMIWKDIKGGHGRTGMSLRNIEHDREDIDDITAERLRQRRLDRDRKARKNMKKIY